MRTLRDNSLGLQVVGAARVSVRAMAIGIIPILSAFSAP
jgi:hypothetical protein